MRAGPGVERARIVRERRRSPRGPPRSCSASSRPWRSPADAPRPARRRDASVRTWVHMRASGKSWLTPAPPCICTAWSITSSATRGAITLICEMSGAAARTPCVSIAQAALRHSRRAISMLMRASAMMSGLAPSRASFWPKAERVAGAPAHRLERPLGLADGAHAMVDAPRAEPPLRDLEAAPAAEDQRVLRNAHVVEADMHVAVRRVVVAVDLHRPQDLDALASPRGRAASNGARAGRRPGRSAPS